MESWVLPFATRSWLARERQRSRAAAFPNAVDMRGLLAGFGAQRAGAATWLPGKEGRWQASPDGLEFIVAIERYTQFCR